MSHQLLHILTHLGVHLGHYLAEKSHHPPAGCRKCRTTSGTMSTTNCCQARLCASCLARYDRECPRTCTFCGNDVIRK
ncbi:unnamed protein product [Gemmata massiliana]|uniref:Uncharacterized protein n=1 Tax=Gemmata massiliana TaxID=1210884 RepID=A0A6P2CY00_9BACT|nr:hypothetical protein [Gemmata massiliana]VTR93417.1 unnamed protein product [Gemmata massiliana]